MRKTYATDLSDEEWAYLRARLPELPKTVRMRAHALRDVFDAIFYVLRSGCPWRMLPGDFPPWPTVYYHFRRFRLSGLWHRAFVMLRAAERMRVGKYPGASIAIVDSQSTKTTEEGAGSNGYDAHKNVKGRKRHLLVDTLGLPLSIYVTPADVQDRAGARFLLAGLRACLVSNRVRLGGTKSASPPRRKQHPADRFYKAASSFLKRFYQRELSDSSSAYATTPKRFNPHPYQTGSKMGIT